MRLLPSVFVLSLIGSVAHAQTNLPDVTGRWSTGDCATSYYDWSFDGGLVRFRDNRNRTYAERIVASGPDGFTTVETSGRAPAQWIYRLLGPDTIAIQNLATGQRFTQHRCTTTAALPPALARQQPGQAELRLGYSSTLGVEVFARGPDWCATNIALRVVARDQRTFADPALAALLQRLGQSVIGRSCPVAAEATFQGSVGTSSNGWQRHAAAASDWAIAESGVDLDATLANPAPPVAGRPNTGLAAVPAPAPATPLQPARSPVAVANVPNVTPRVDASNDIAEPLAQAQACPANYPGPDNNRSPMLCTCDTDSLGSGTVIGTGLYGYASVVCRAARHAGAIEADGGAVLFIPLPGQTNLVGSDRNGISSGGGQGEGFRPYRATPALARYVQRWLDVLRQAAHPNGVRTADGRILIPVALYPPLPLGLVPVQPVQGTSLEMPGVNQMALPVPPMPLSGPGLAPSPWAASP